MVVRQAHNLKVAGSSPASATNTGTRGRSTLNRLAVCGVFSGLY